MSKSDDKIALPKRISEPETKSLTIEEVNRFDKMEKVDVKCILGDPELHSDLVEDVDSEVDENNFAPGIDATDQEKIEFLTKKVVFLEEKVKYLEGLLNIRGETETEKSKETEAATKTKNADYELDETEVLQDYIDAKRQEIAKGKKNVVRPPREVDHQDEDDTEVEHGAKESDTSKVNEGHRHEEEEQQQEDDTKVNADVDVGAKESENPKTNEDGEVNEDACKKPVKGTKKRGRGTKGMKKGVISPREVEQQVEDDAEVDVGAKEIENLETNEVS
ncbi:BnaCnng68110D [Brassica napus]|uniref:BnaCnng68110D protein n=1 Tax=Brassica napus TaxID=3708 RepID=A0A078JUC6_BRANA|nr:BnaCnng68110D [Brassica napus]